MPKSNFEIETFSVGVVSNPSDERDIPKNAATYSLNLDPLDASELSGIPDDYFLRGGGFNSSYWGFTYHAGSGSGQNEGYEPIPDDDDPVQSSATNESN